MKKMLFLEREKNIYKETHTLLMCLHGSLTKLSLYDFLKNFCTHSNDCAFMNLQMKIELNEN